MCSVTQGFHGSADCSFKENVHVSVGRLIGELSSHLGEVDEVVVDLITGIGNPTRQPATVNLANVYSCESKNENTWSQ